MKRKIILGLLGLALILLSACGSTGGAYSFQNLDSAFTLKSSQIRIMPSDLIFSISAGSASISTMNSNFGWFYTGVTLNSYYGMNYPFYWAQNSNIYVKNYAKPLSMSFWVRRSTSVATSYVWVGIRDDSWPACTTLAEDGLGIYISNLTLYGETYDSARYTVSLGTTMTSGYGYFITILHRPGIGVEWYVNGVLKGTSTHEPDSATTGYTDAVVCLGNGATATSAILYISDIQINNTY